MLILGQLFILAATGFFLWYFIELGWMEGTRGRNGYGDDPLETPAGAV